MVKGRSFLVLLVMTLIVAGLAQRSNADLVINEVMANEPGGSTTLEWIEIYNSSQTPRPLHTLRMEVDGAPVVLPALPDVQWLDPAEYFIICRSFSSFESIWGNNSGIWGDSPAELNVDPPYQTRMVLKNSSGSILLINYLSETVSSFAWTEDGLDGHSWERVYPDSAYIGQSVDSIGSTPGFVNSLSPVGHDLALDSVKVTFDDGLTYLTFQLVNRGLDSYTDGAIELVNEGPPGGPILSEPIASITVPPTPPGYTTLITEQFFLDGLYLNLRASLPPDDRNRNNSLGFVAVGDQYPPAHLWEILANPQAGSGLVEWVEIRSRALTTIDLSGWMLTAGNTVRPIADTSVIMYTEQLLVLTEDGDAIYNYYPRFAGELIELASWPNLVLDADTVRLLDGYGFEVDRFEYQSTFSDNFTWARQDTAGSRQWGRSASPGGTPGEVNDVLFQPTASRTRIRLESKYISPDGDGFEDSVRIAIEAVPATAYTMKIYDRQGREVYTFFTEQAFIKDEYIWNGGTSSGSRLPIGIYILYFEAIGVESVKETLVIAR